MLQELTLKAFDESNQMLGTFKITSEINFEEKLVPKLSKVDETIKIDNYTLKNIPIVEDLDDEVISTFSPIVFCTDSFMFPKIILTEETKYKIHFKPKDQEVTPFNHFDNFKFKPLDLLNKKEGFLNYRSYVGKSFLDLTKNNEIIFEEPLEVKSKKMNYSNQYQAMIGDLSQFSSGLIFSYNSPVYQDFELNIQGEKNFYEYYVFLEYLFREENLPSTFEYLSRNLYTRLEEYIEAVPAEFASNITPDSLIEMVSDPENLIDTGDEDSYLNGYLPIEINEIKYDDDLNTPENKFYKNFLETVDDLIAKLLTKSSGNDFINEQLRNYKEQMSYFLSQRYFKEISRMDYPPLNSQVLQKKEGYRDILEYFLILEFTYRMHWGELTEKFVGFEKQLSTLYEYWCYLELVDVLAEVCNCEITFEDVFSTVDDWNITLKEIIEPKKLQLNVDGFDIILKLFYQKSFTQKGGQYYSYSNKFDPDYTLEIQLNDNIYYIHFDAKYKVYLESESFKEDDINKMHTYKDAILNTIGAFILYPGADKTLYKDKNDLKYGVGAFPLNPGEDEVEKERLVSFIKEQIQLLVDYHNKELRLS